MASQDITFTYTVTTTRTVPRKSFPASMSTQDIINAETNRVAGEQVARIIMRRDTANFPYTAAVVVTETGPAAP